MRQSDTAFVVTIAVGFLWGWATKALNDWGKREDERKRRERLVRYDRARHPSWGNNDN